MNVNSNFEENFIFQVKEVDGPTIATHTFYSQKLGLKAISGFENLDYTDTKNVTFAVNFIQDKRYRFELELEFKVRVAFSVSATTCANDTKIKSGSETFNGVV